MREPACWGQEGVWNTFRTGQITSSLEGSAGAAATALPLLPKIPGDRTNVKRGANVAARTADAFQAVTVAGVKGIHNMADNNPQVSATTPEPDKNKPIPAVTQPLEQPAKTEPQSTPETKV
jgi:hypothetical protein